LYSATLGRNFRTKTLYLHHPTVYNLTLPINYRRGQCYLRFPRQICHPVDALSHKASRRR